MRIKTSIHCECGKELFEDFEDEDMDETVDISNFLSYARQCGWLYYDFQTTWRCRGCVQSFGELGGE